MLRIRVMSLSRASVSYSYRTSSFLQSAACRTGSSKGNLQSNHVISSQGANQTRGDVCLPPSSTFSPGCQTADPAVVDHVPFRVTGGQTGLVPTLSHVRFIPGLVTLTWAGVTFLASLFRGIAAMQTVLISFHCKMTGIVCQ